VGAGEVSACGQKVRPAIVDDFGGGGGRGEASAWDGGVWLCI